MRVFCSMVRAVVIGAGHNGLVAAYNLAARGFDVLVVEASGRLGGMADTSAVGGVLVSRASYVLGVMDRRLIELFGVPVLDCDPYIVLLFEGKTIPLWKDPVRRRVEFERAGFERYGEFEERLLAFKRLMEEHTFTPEPPSREALLEEAERLGLEDFLRKGCERLLSEYFPKELHGFFYYPGMESSPAYLVAYFFNEWHVVRGGMGAVAEAVWGKAAALGAKLLLNSKATRILTREGRVVGVELNGQSVVEADIVVSTASPLVTASIVEDGLKLELEVPESRWVKHNLVLKRHPRPPEKLRGYVGSLITLEPEGVEAVFPSILDETLGGAVLNVMGPLEPVYQLFPDLRECVKWVDKLTPRIAEELYFLPKGNVNHLPMREPYLFDCRPKKGYAYRTPIRGLYLGGAGTYPGGQVSGAPGYNASQAAIIDFLRKRV